MEEKWARGGIHPDAWKCVKYLALTLRDAKE